MLCSFVYSTPWLSDIAKQTPSTGYESFMEKLLTGEMEDDVHIFLDVFREKSMQMDRGRDAEMRPIYVSAQGEFERTMVYLLEEGKVDHLFGIIHTPTPATPLCTQGDISPDLVAESMKDQRRLFTVMKRPEIIRELLAKGGVLIAAYPEGGREKRTAEQLAVFDELIATYPQNLIDLPLQCTAMEKEMVGASYLFRTIDGNWMAFSIMASQANAPEDDRTWGMWFGPIQDPQVFHRIETVFNYLHKVQPLIATYFTPSVFQN